MTRRQPHVRAHVVETEYPSQRCLHHDFLDLEGFRPGKIGITKEG
jgi:hypothetical protein